MPNSFSEKICKRVVFTAHAMIPHRLAKVAMKRKQSLSKKLSKSLTKKIITNHYKRVLLAKHAKVHAKI